MLFLKNILSSCCKFRPSWKSNFKVEECIGEITEKQIPVNISIVFMAYISSVITSIKIELVQSLTHYVSSVQSVLLYFFLFSGCSKELTKRVGRLWLDILSLSNICIFNPPSHFFDNTGTTKTFSTDPTLVVCILSSEHYWSRLAHNTADHTQLHCVVSPLPVNSTIVSFRTFLETISMRL